jgi:predicted dehydrogenase
LNILVAGRALDDDGNVLLKFDNGAAGVLVASQVAAGEENALRVRIYGEHGGLDWSQMEPNSLIVKWLDKPMQILRAGTNGFLNAEAILNSRTPAGHPEGYLEAFANLYRNFAWTLAARMDGQPVPKDVNFPTVEEGIRGMAFIDSVVKSGQSKEKWTPFEI